MQNATETDFVDLVEAITKQKNNVGGDTIFAISI